MNEKNSKLKTYISACGSAFVMIGVFAYWFGAFSADSASLAFAALSNACFVTAVLYIGVGALIWISTTGLFDIFGFGFKSLKYLFTPIAKDPNEGGYYEYMMEKREKRKGKPIPYFMLVIGVVALALSIIFLVLWNATGAVDIIM